MKEFSSSIEDNGQFRLDLPVESKIIDSKEDDSTYLSSDDLLELEKEDPVAYEALMNQIKKQEEQKEIERLAMEVEARENSEKIQKEEDELRASIKKAYEDFDIAEERDDKTGGYGHFAKIARETKENKSNHKHH